MLRQRSSNKGSSNETQVATTTIIKTNVVWRSGGYDVNLWFSIMEVVEFESLFLKKYLDKFT